ncbi:MAG: hydrogenase formation protein HypD [Nitrososphaerales archaeon]
MKETLEYFKDPSWTKIIAERIKDLAPSRNLKFCHVCGTHEYSIFRYGLRSFLPRNVEVIAGPGCPVCICPASDIDEAIWLTFNGVTVVTYGDMLRVRGSKISLREAKALGGEVKVAYSISDGVKMAESEPNKEFVFFSIGFETTAITTAAAILKSPPKNLSFLISHRLIPPVMELLLGIGDLQIDGYIAPGHVSTIIGMKPYEVFPKAYRMPTVVAGFEPTDVLLAILMLLKQVNSGTPKLENEYSRVVKWDGNVKAKKMIDEVFKIVDGRWRGLGRVPYSALKLKEEFLQYDARERYEINIGSSRDLLPGCSCHLVMIGKITPLSCPLFTKACTPEDPKGPCMVSSEGTCFIWHRFHQISKRD